MDIFNYSRRETSEVNIGATPMGGSNPIRIQSMTNTSTQDTDACVAQAKRIVDAGGEYVRLTTQGIKEAENLMNINAALRRDGYMVPLVADVHFNPKVADVAAQYAEKVRINPGNYVDAARTFKHLEYTDEEYAQEVRKIRDRFVPFLNICKANHTAHRTPEAVEEFAKGARKRGIKVIIAAAGMAAALPGVIAANTTLPVIGVPVKGSVLDGVDALYSIIQMPPGIPVATVAINGAMNAAILAVQMLALSDTGLAEAFTAYKEGLKKKIVKANEDLKEVKYEYKVN